MRDHIESGFERWGRLLVRHRWLAIASTLALTLALASQLPRLAMDNTVEGFLHDDDLTLIRYNEFRDQFGRDDVTIVAIEASDVFDLAFLEELRELHAELEAEVPHLDEITSLVNARSTRGEGNELIVEDLLADWPRDPEQLARLRERVFANPLYLDTLISADGRITTVTLKPDTYSSLGAGDALTGFDEAGRGADSAEAEPTYLTEVESAALVQAVREVVARHAGPGFAPYLAGAAVVEERVIDEMQADLARFLSTAVAIIVLLLFAVFRRVSGVVLPLVTVASSLVATVGLMVLLDIALSLTTEVMPLFLMAVGVCYSVHVLAIFFQRLDAGAAREDAIAGALGHTGLAVVMTSLTTAGGLVSFAWATVAQVSELGIVAPIGVVLALVFSLVLLPALLAVAPVRRAEALARPRNRLLVGLVVRTGALSARRPWVVIAASGVVLALAAGGAAKLRFANDYFLWFPRDAPLRVATDFIDRELHGVVTLEAIIDTGEVNGLHRPELMRRFEEIAAANESIQHGELFIGKTISIADVLKETHQALNENRPEFYATPDDRRLIAQELLLFENSGSDDLEELVDSQFRTARISMKIPWADWMLYPDFLAKVQRRIEEIAGDEVRVTLTGFSALMARAASSLNLTLARSYVIALVIITPLMIFLLGSLKRGLLSMAPNLAPVLITLGLMGWLDIPLDMSTLLIGGIVIGLAVDDTIHFMHGFNRRFAETGDPDRAVRETLGTTGAAMLFTSIVLTAGFFVFTLAYMSNIVVFGLLCGVATLIAFLADVTLAPALMILVTRKRPGVAAART
jgi:predicted RND superfamily exporter protein